MADDIMDVAVSADVNPGADLTTEVDTPVEASTDAANVDNVDKTTDEENKDSDVLNADGTPKTEAQKAKEAEAKANASSDGKVTPDSVSKVLKAIKDADPKNAGAAKALRDAYFGEQAFKKEFPTVKEAREAKAFIAAIGGAEGWENTQNVIQNIEQSDALVHEGDPQIWDNIIDDLKSENHLDALPKLAAGGLDKLKAINNEQFEEVIAPHFLAGLEQVNLPRAISSLTKYLGLAEQELTKAEYKGETRGIAALKQIVADMDGWIKGLQAEGAKKQDATTKVDPEREKLNKEREQFNKEKEERTKQETQSFKNDVATVQEKYSNITLGTSLGTYLRMPFFKSMPQNDGKGGHAPWAVNLGNGIKARLYDTLEHNSAYQTQMKALWRQKTPDRAKIEQVHKETVDSIAAEVVKQEVEARYPNYAKGGSAAGRVAAVAAKKETNAKVSAASVTSGKPVYVAERPASLIREQVTINGKTYSPSDLTLLQITGKGFVKANDGKFRFVTWKK